MGAKGREGEAPSADQRLYLPPLAPQQPQGRLPLARFAASHLDELSMSYRQSWSPASQQTRSPHKGPKVLQFPWGWDGDVCRWLPPPGGSAHRPLLTPRGQGCRMACACRHWVQELPQATDGGATGLT